MFQCQAVAQLVGKFLPTRLSLFFSLALSVLYVVFFVFVFCPFLSALKLVEPSLEIWFSLSFYVIGTLWFDHTITRDKLIKQKPAYSLCVSCDWKSTNTSMLMVF